MQCSGMLFFLRVLFPTSMLRRPCRSALVVSWLAFFLCCLPLCGHAASVCAFPWSLECSGMLLLLRVLFLHQCFLVPVVLRWWSLGYTVLGTIFPAASILLLCVPFPRAFCRTFVLASFLYQLAFLLGFCFQIVSVKRIQPALAVSPLFPWDMRCWFLSVMAWRAIFAERGFCILHYQISNRARCTLPFARGEVGRPRLSGLDAAHPSNPWRAASGEVQDGATRISCVFNLRFIGRAGWSWGGP